jgi:CheY-like chemotaxis protein
MSSPFKVLLVEDIKIARLAVKSSVSSLNWQIDMAESGQEAILFCEKTSYDLVLMDIGLPDISGVEAAKVIKRNHPDVPIVALTAHFDDETKASAMAAGMDGFIQKPFTLDKARKLCLKHVATC